MGERKIQLVFSLDTTTSMNPCTEEVRSSVKSFMGELLSIPGMSIALVAHGDYPKDNEEKFVIAVQDFTRDLSQLCQFVSKLENTFGIDYPECYELALRKMNDSLSWVPDSHKVAVVIGDDVPHEPGASRNPHNIDWRAELDKLVKKGVKFYGVQCLSRPAEDFYRTLAERSGGQHLRLPELPHILVILKAIAYRQEGPVRLQEYENEVMRTTGNQLPVDVSRIFEVLKGE